MCVFKRAYGARPLNPASSCLMLSPACRLPHLGLYSAPFCVSKMVSWRSYSLKHDHSVCHSSSNLGFIANNNQNQTGTHLVWRPVKFMKNAKIRRIRRPIWCGISAKRRPITCARFITAIAHHYSTKTRRPQSDITKYVQHIDHKKVGLFRDNEKSNNLIRTNGVVDWAKQVDWRESSHFPTGTANFQQRRLLVLNIFISSLNSPKWGEEFSPKFFGEETGQYCPLWPPPPLIRTCRHSVDQQHSTSMPTNEPSFLHHSKFKTIL